MAFNILIVDDSATTRAIIKRAIVAAELPLDGIFEGANGEEGLKHLAANRIDIVLADLHMPKMDGIEMTRRILADPKTSGIPIVIISAEPNAERIAALKAQGVRGYLRKPFTPEAVRETLNSILGVAHA